MAAGTTSTCDRPHERRKGTQCVGIGSPLSIDFARMRRAGGERRYRFGVGVFGRGGTVVIREYSKIAAATAFSAVAIPLFFPIASTM